MPVSPELFSTLADFLKIERSWTLFRAIRNCFAINKRFRDFVATFFWRCCDTDATLYCDVDATSRRICVYHIDFCFFSISTQRAHDVVRTSHQTSFSGRRPLNDVWWDVRTTSCARCFITNNVKMFVRILSKIELRFDFFEIFISVSFHSFKGKLEIVAFLLRIKTNVVLMSHFSRD